MASAVVKIKLDWPAIIESLALSADMMEDLSRKWQLMMAYSRCPTTWEVV